MKTSLRKAWILAAVILIACNLANGQDRRIELAAGSLEISLVLPVELEAFSEAQMALVREKGIAAQYIFSDPQRDLIAAINTFGSGAHESELAKVGEQLEAAAKKRGGVAGEVKRDIITMNGKKWLYVSFKEGTGSAELINDYFVTDWVGKYVLINFSSPTARYESYKGVVERSAQSVQLGFVAKSTEVDSRARSDKKDP